MLGVSSLDVGALRIVIRRDVETESLEDDGYWSCGIRCGWTSATGGCVTTDGL